MKAPLPENELARLDALHRYEILDTAAEQAFDAIARAAAHVFGTPIALISLVDAQRQWFKAKVGLDLSETPRDMSFCAHTMQQTKPLIVEDASKDERFHDNALVTGAPNIRFYAGAPLRTPQGLGLGSVCIIDRRPRQLDDGQKEVLQCFAAMVMTTLELRRISRQISDQANDVDTLHDLLPVCPACEKIRDDKPYWEQLKKFLRDHPSPDAPSAYCAQCRS
jgi:GAF domain-containing protein